MTAAPPSLLRAVAAMVGEPVEAIGPTERGESRSTQLVRATSGDLIVKSLADHDGAFENQERLVHLVASLRRRGAPTPRYRGVGRVDDTVFTVQERIPGVPLEPSPGARPDPTTFAAVLPQLLAAIDIQRGAGDLADPPWPAWLLRTIDEGGDGYCIHATMRARPDTDGLLDRIQDLAARHRHRAVAAGDVLHYDLNPANVLHVGTTLTGIVDWGVPFTGAAQGDRGFDVATLLFYTYDLDVTRADLWAEATRISGAGWTAIYLAHLTLRQVEWTVRHRPGDVEETRFLGIAGRVLDDCEALDP